MTAPEVRREYPNLNRQFHFIAFRQAAGDGSRSLSSDAAADGLVDAAAGGLVDAAAGGLVDAAAGGLLDAEEAHQADDGPVRGMDRIIEMTRRHRGLTVEAVARWEARERS